MRIRVGVSETESERRKPVPLGTRSHRFGENYAAAMAAGGSVWSGEDDRAQELSDEQEDRPEAIRIYEAVAAGRRALEGLRQAAKVPYGYLAKDGVINYNGVCFVCDERTNSICLGDMTDKSKVLTIGLSGGGCLKVNRDSLGTLSKAIGMFSPEDVNRIMRAIALDTKLQSMQKELEDLEASVGEQLDASRQEPDDEKEGI